MNQSFINTKKSLTDTCLIADVLEKNVEGLEQLHTDVSAKLLPHETQEKCQHIFLKEKAA